MSYKSQQSNNDSNDSKTASKEELEALLKKASEQKQNNANAQANSQASTNAQAGTNAKASTQAVEENPQATNDAPPENAEGNQVVKSSDVEGGEKASSDKKQTGKYGKFNSLQDLIKGYAMLEASFTKKCQECKELEKTNTMIHEEKQHMQSKMDNIMQDDSFVESKVINDESVKNRIIFDYLKSCFSQEDTVKPLGTGVGVSGVTPIKKPRTLSEAGQMVERMLGR